MGFTEQPANSRWGGALPRAPCRPGPGFIRLHTKAVTNVLEVLESFKKPRFENSQLCILWFNGCKWLFSDSGVKETVFALFPINQLTGDTRPSPTAVWEIQSLTSCVPSSELLSSLPVWGWGGLVLGFLIPAKSPAERPLCVGD